MDWQLLLAILAIIAAAVYVSRRAWRTWGHKGSGCGGGCGSGCKSAAPTTGDVQGRLIPLDQITVRRHQ
jgi:FeoB-associated Cys-rich membrane protein